MSALRCVVCGVEANIDRTYLHTAADCRDALRRQVSSLTAELEAMKDGCERQTLDGIGMRAEIDSLTAERDVVRDLLTKALPWLGNFRGTPDAIPLISRITSYLERAPESPHE